MTNTILRLALIFALLAVWVASPDLALAEGDPPPTEPALPGGTPEAQDPAAAPTLLATETITGTQPLSPEAPTAFSVNSTQDLPDTNPGNGSCLASNGKCTLRAAVQESNALSGSQVVTLPNGVYPIGSELAVTGSLTINGASQGSTIIDGQHATRCLNFAANSGAQAVSNLTIRNCTNKNTTDPQRFGGGIFNSATLSLRSVTLSGNTAYIGGGVHNHFWYAGSNIVPSLTMESVTITGNTATATTIGFGGGGLFNGSRLVGNNVTITANLALQGGGFYNNSFHPEIKLTNFKISGNSAKYGGGIDNDETERTKGYGITLQSGEISNNAATCCDPSSGKATGGGGIYNNMAYMWLTDVAISGNIAYNGTASNLGYGGGIVNIQYMSLTNVSVTDNQAAYGAGIYNGNYYNTAGLSNQLNVVNGTFGGNKGLAGNDAQGAALFNVGAGYLGGGKAKLVNTTITANSALVTGGITNNGSSVQIKNTILAGNSDTYGAPDCRGTITSLGYNIVNSYTGGKNFPCTFNVQSSDQVGIIPAMAPRMGSPAYYALLQGSTAIDRGTTSECPSVDILHQTRPYGRTCDVGSYEWHGSNIKLNFLYLPIVRKR